jgi:hypothetical protein
VRVSSNIIIQTSYGGDDLDGSRLERIRFHTLAFESSEPAVRESVAFLKKYAAWNANMYKELDLQFPCAIAVEPILNAVAARGPLVPDAVALFATACLSIHAKHHAARRHRLNVSIATAVVQLWRVGPITQNQLDALVHHYTKAIVAPGEGVGALGASSIGEPSMQKTLNTFHYTGIADKNVTIMGLPRFKQIINGIDTYETANMVATLKTYENSKEAIQISRVMLGDLLKSTSTGPGQDHIAFHGSPHGSLQKFAGTGGFTMHLHFDWTAMARKNITIDAVAKSLRETLGYDAFILKKPHWCGSITILMAPWIGSQHATAFMEALVNQHQVRGIDYIKNAIVFQEKRYNTKLESSGIHVVETEGSNMVGLASCSAIVPESIRSTNIVEVCATLGIGAGVAVLQSELHKVLSFDGSYIDPRHTWLLADTMGRSGSLVAMNRHHMTDLGSSLLQEASFERSLDVFEEGAAFGRSDDLAGATERIIVGQPVCIGTGMVGLISNVEISKEPEMLVMPMAHEAHYEANGPVGPHGPNGADVIVRSMNYTESTFNASGYLGRLTDMDRVSSNAFLESCAAAFRSTAATRRIVPFISFETFLKDQTYLSINEECHAMAQWTTKESSSLYTEVFWTSKTGQTGLTILLREVPTSYSIDVYSKETGKIACEIFSKRRLENLELPFGVECTRVCMRQQSLFTKGPFLLKLGRMWTAENNVECEKAMLGTRGRCFALLESIDSEALLQSRCTDAQLGNAFFVRLPL